MSSHHSILLLTQSIITQGRFNVSPLPSLIGNVSEFDVQVLRGCYNPILGLLRRKLSSEANPAYSNRSILAIDVLGQGYLATQERCR